MSTQSDILRRFNLLFGSFGVTFAQYGTATMSRKMKFNIDPDDEFFAECSSCTIPCKKQTAIWKKCSSCNKEGYVHQACAAKFYMWRKDSAYFDPKKFTNHHFKFFCSLCHREECSFCEKKHTINEKHSYPVMCSEGHWLIVSKNCAPLLFQGTTKKNIWYCKSHNHQPDNSSVPPEITAAEDSFKNFDSPEKIIESLHLLPMECNQNHSSSVYDKITYWASGKERKPVSFFRKLYAKDNFDAHKFHTNIIEQFKKEMDTINNARRRLTTKDIAERKKDKIFLDYIYDNFWDKDRFSSIITSDFEFQYNMSPYSLDILYNFGKPGWLNDEVIGMFYSLLQEFVIIDNADKEQKLPVIYLDSQAIFFMYPQEHQWPQLKIELLFDEQWMIEQENLANFSKLYKFWYEEKNRKFLGNIFSNLQDLNEVSYF